MIDVISHTRLRYYPVPSIINSVEIADFHPWRRRIDQSLNPNGLIASPWLYLAARRTWTRLKCATMRVLFKPLPSLLSTLDLRLLTKAIHRLAVALLANLRSAEVTWIKWSNTRIDSPPDDHAAFMPPLFADATLMAVFWGNRTRVSKHAEFYMNP